MGGQVVRGVHPRLMTDGKMVFDSYADLIAWAKQWCAEHQSSQVESVPVADQSPQAPQADTRPSSSAKSKLQVLKKKKRKGSFTVKPKPKAAKDEWTPEQVKAFLTSVGLRSREMAKCAVIKGVTGMSATAFAEELNSDVNGIGKRFTKLARDSEEFSPSLPVPARLTGPQGERELFVDPSFAASYKELANVT